MARISKTRSVTLDNAEKRAAALAAIEPPLKLGGAISVAGFQKRVADARAQLSAYNGLLAEADRIRVEFLVAERALALHHTRMLAAVAGHYGKDSSVYAAAGGTTLQARKRPKRKAASSGEKLPNAA